MWLLGYALITIFVLLIAYFRAIYSDSHRSHYALLYQQKVILFNIVNNKRKSHPRPAISVGITNQDHKKRNARHKQDILGWLQYHIRTRLAVGMFAIFSRANVFMQSRVIKMNFYRLVVRQSRMKYPTVLFFSAAILLTRLFVFRNFARRH